VKTGHSCAAVTHHELPPGGQAARAKPIGAQAPVKARSEEARLRRANLKIPNIQTPKNSGGPPGRGRFCDLVDGFWDLRARVRANAESEYLVPKGSRVPPRNFLRAASAKSSSQNEA